MRFVAVEEVMSSEFITVDAGETIRSAAQLMEDLDISFLIVIEDNKAIGIITSRDLLSKVICYDLNPHDSTVRQIMSSPIIAALSSMTVQDAVAIMLHSEVKRLPVICSTDLIGVITLADIAKFQPEAIQRHYLPQEDLQPVLTEKNFYVC